MKDNRVWCFMKLIMVLYLFVIITACEQKSGNTVHPQQKLSTEKPNVTKITTNNNTKPLAKPGTRQYSVTWVDTKGNLWLFGGIQVTEANSDSLSDDYIGAAADVFLNDLWMYNPTTDKWTLITPNNKVNRAGSYGKQGVVTADNYPGARSNAISWTDKDGNFWMFGGTNKSEITATDEENSKGNSGNKLNDLWKYNPNNNTWTWVSGSKLVNDKGHYGTKGVASQDNIPSARSDSVSWIDKDGNFWLFGGSVVAQGTCNGENDLWKYNPTDNTWTWVAGSNLINQPGKYGAKGVGAVDNIPGAREGALSWTDKDGNFWLFGGYIDDGSDFVFGVNVNFFANDLWKYNPADSKWTWVSGDAFKLDGGSGIDVYGIKGKPSIKNIPGARSLSIAYIDSVGNFWLFGGRTGYVSNYQDSGKAWSTRELNDLWRYNPKDNMWTWISGANTAEEPPVYGTKGLPSIDVIPGAGYGFIGWSDKNNNFWLFSNNMATLWKYNLKDNLWTWVSGAKLDY